MHVYWIINMLSPVCSHAIQKNINGLGLYYMRHVGITRTLCGCDMHIVWTSYTGEGVRMPCKDMNATSTSSHIATWISHAHHLGTNSPYLAVLFLILVSLLSVLVPACVRGWLWHRVYWGLAGQVSKEMIDADYCLVFETEFPVHRMSWLSYDSAVIRIGG